MKSPLLKIFILLVLLGSGSFGVKGQDSSLLWKVSGNGLAKESYLFGTIHIICKEDFVMDERITAAFNQSEQLILELDMSDPNLATAMQQASLNPGMKSIQGDFDAQTVAQLDEFLTKNYGAGLDQLGVLKPFVLTSMVMLKSLPCPEVESYEGYFTSKASSSGKSIKGLETVEFQVSIFDKIPQEIQLEELGKLVTDDSTKAELETMMAAYQTENIESLFGQMNSSPMWKNYREIMLDERNKSWIPQIEEAMKSNTVFVAVGAAHLGGEFGVIALLRNAGYRVEPVSKNQN